MAKNLPGLVIKIGANTQDAISGLNKVNRALGSSASRSDRFAASMRKAAPALGLAAAAAGALAVKMGTDAVQAAMEEEVSVSRLARTLGNLGLASADPRVEAFIDNMQFATGIADNDLRPAMDRLVRSTQDVGTAQTALALSADIATAKGRNVTDVANILGKAYDGNTMALGRLGVGLDKSVLKSGDMVKITAELTRLFSGQAATAADTLQGRMNILRIGVDELQESFGKGLIQGFMDGLSDGSGSLEDATATLRENQATLETWGKVIGGTLADAIGWLDDFGLGAMKMADVAADASDIVSLSFINMADTLNIISDEQGAAMRASLEAGDAAREQAMRNYVLKGSLDATESAANGAANATARLTTAAESNANRMDKQRTAADKLKSSLDRLNNNRSIMQQKFDLAGLLQNGPGKSGQRKGADGKMTDFTTLRDRKEFAFTVADQYANLADSYKNGSRKRGALADAREAIRGMNLPAGFQSDLIDTLTPAARSRTRPGTPQTGQQVAGVNYNFYGDIKVADGQAARQAAKEARRLAALSGSRYAGMAETGRGY